MQRKTDISRPDPMFRLKIIKIGFVMFCMMIIHNAAYAQNPADYLILRSIGQYHNSGKGKCGNGSGILGGSDHFDEDHIITTCKTGYYFMDKDLAVSIKVEQHTGGDSDRWLLHEMDADFRNSYGIPDLTYTVRTINGNIILVDATGGRDYRWLSGNKVITLEYNTPTVSSTPEPLDVVQAYLAKHPSTISSITLPELRGNTNVTKWIKDEIDRRLWLCDKWNAQWQAGGVVQSDLIVKLLENLDVFLKYRQKYFGISYEDDDRTLDTYQENNDLASIQKKLADYKTWWNANKGKGITLP